MVMFVILFGAIWLLLLVVALTAPYEVIKRRIWHSH